MQLGDINSSKHSIFHPSSNGLESTIDASERITVRLRSVKGDVPGQEGFHVGGSATGVLASHDGFSRSKV